MTTGLENVAIAFTTSGHSDGIARNGRRCGADPAGNSVEDPRWSLGLAYVFGSSIAKQDSWPTARPWPELAKLLSRADVALDLLRCTTARASCRRWQKCSSTAAASGVGTDDRARVPEAGLLPFVAAGAAAAVLRQSWGTWCHSIRLAEFCAEPGGKSCARCIIGNQCRFGSCAGRPRGRRLVGDGSVLVGLGTADCGPRSPSASCACASYTAAGTTGRGAVLATEITRGGQIVVRRRCRYAKDALHSPCAGAVYSVHVRPYRSGAELESRPDRPVRGWASVHRAGTVSWRVCRSALHVGRAVCCPERHDLPGVQRGNRVIVHANASHRQRRVRLRARWHRRGLTGGARGVDSQTSTRAGRHRPRSGSHAASALAEDDHL
jgi:hypothetical protein